MASFQVLYWHDVPTQVKAKDERGTANVQLNPRFMLKVDQLAMEKGLFGTDEYLDGWQWSDAQSRDGTASEVAEAVKNELEANFTDGRDTVQ